MASYPGRFTSGDDFYITSARLAIQETTIAIWDESLNKNIKPQSVLQWARSSLATRLASTAEEWVYYYSLYNSGLYNNQWMVFDYNRFHPGKGLDAGAFWIYEQIPDVYKRQDPPDHVQHDNLGIILIKCSYVQRRYS